jgi:hypothetical protein
MRLSDSPNWVILITHHMAEECLVVRIPLPRQTTCARQQWFNKQYVDTACVEREGHVHAACDLKSRPAST